MTNLALNDPNMSLPRACLFDWDNTLVDSVGVSWDALNHTLNHMRHPLRGSEKVRNLPPTSLRQKFRELFAEQDNRAADVYYKFYHNVHLERLVPFQGVEDLLKFFHEKSIYCAIVSNKNGDFLRREVAHLGWTRYFGSIVGSCDLQDDKPSSLVVHHALAPSGISASPEVWFVGDSAIDVQCAKNSGCTPILVHHGDGDLRTQKGLVVVENCQELHNHIKDL